MKASQVTTEQQAAQFVQQLTQQTKSAMRQKFPTLSEQQIDQETDRALAAVVKQLREGKISV